MALPLFLESIWPLWCSRGGDPSRGARRSVRRRSVPRLVAGVELHRADHLQQFEVRTKAVRLRVKGGAQWARGRNRRPVLSTDAF